MGAVYVYDNENVNYIQAVENPLESSGLNPEDYTYEFVNGLPGIRYPVAVVFSLSYRSKRQLRMHFQKTAKT